MSKIEKEKLIEQKFKNKEELAKAKEEFSLSIKNISSSLKAAKLKERQLKEDIRKEKIKQKAEIRKQKESDSHEIRKQKVLFDENKSLLIDHKKKVSSEIKLIKSNQNLKKLETKKAEKTKLLKAKSEVKSEIANQKQKLKEVQNQLSKEKIDNKKHLEEKKEKDAIELAKQKDELTERKLELQKNKKDLKRKRAELKRKALQEKQARVLKVKSEKQELRLAKQKAKAEHKRKMLELKKKSAEEAEEKIIDLNELKVNVNDKKKEVNNLEKELKLEETEAIKEQSKEVEGILEDVISKEAEAIENNENVDESLEAIEDDVDLTPTQVLEPSWTQEQSSINYRSLELMTKKGLKLYDKANKLSSKLELDKLKLSSTNKELIREFISHEDNENFTDIREFAKYVYYMNDKEYDKKDVSVKFKVPVVNILQGKTVSAFGGYFSMIKSKGFSFIKFYEHKPVADYQIVSATNDELSKEIEDLILDKLKKGSIVKLTNNLALKYKEEKVVVLHNLPFIK